MHTEPTLSQPAVSHTAGATRRAMLRAALFSGLGQVSILSAAPRPGGPQTMKLQIRLDTLALLVLLDDNPSARDLLELLPLQLTLEDYAATEKIAPLPRRLSTAQAPRGITPRAGDLAYYAPWGNLALFHKDFSFSAGLVRLGRIEQGIEVLARPGRLTSVWVAEP